MRGADTFWVATALLPVRTAGVLAKTRRAGSFCFTELPPLWPTAMFASAALGLAEPAQAQQLPATATWNPPPAEWNAASAWSPRGPPTDTAIFPAGVSTTVNVPPGTTIGTLVFEAPNYTVNVGPGTATVNITGQGILTGQGPFDVPDNRPVININNGPNEVVNFLGTSTGGLAKFIIGPGDTLDTSGRSIQTGMTAGSIVNSGLINLASSNIANVGNELTVFGTYMGNGGTLRLNTFLGTDSSPSDKLIINGGPTPAGTRPIGIDGSATATGTTLLQIINAGGPGAQTTANGIQVVQAINGATTTPTAFSLAGGRVTAGAFDYFLFRGGVTQGSQESWF